MLISPWLCLCSCPACPTLKPHAGAFCFSPASLSCPQGTFRGHNKDSPGNPCPWDCTAEQSRASAGLGGPHLPGEASLQPGGGGTERREEVNPPQTGYIFPFPRSLKNLHSVFSLDANGIPAEVVRAALVPLA